MAPPVISAEKREISYNESANYSRGERVELTDYWGSGFDRQYMAPATDKQP